MQLLINDCFDNGYLTKFLFAVVNSNFSPF